MAQQPQTLGDVYNAAGQTYGLSPSLLYAIGTVESGNSTAPVTSSAGAQGIQQVMPSSAPGAGDLQDPSTNIYNSAKILSQFVKQYGGDSAKALMAYNAGTDQSKWNPGYVAKVAAAQQAFTKKFSQGQKPMASQPSAPQDLGGDFPDIPDSTPQAAPAAPAGQTSMIPGDTFPDIPPEGSNVTNPHTGLPMGMSAQGLAEANAGVAAGAVDFSAPPIRAVAYGHDALMRLMHLPSGQWGPAVDAKLAQVQAANAPLANTSEGNAARALTNLAPAALGGAGAEALVGGLGRAAGWIGDAAENLPA